MPFPIALVALAGLGVAALVAASKPTEPTGGGGNGNGGDPDPRPDPDPKPKPRSKAKPEITCAIKTPPPDQRHEGKVLGCDQYVVKYLGQWANVRLVRTFAGDHIRVQVFGVDALLAHEKALSISEAQGLLPYRFSTRFCRHWEGESQDDLRLVRGDCPIDGGVRYAVEWIEQNA